MKGGEVMTRDIEITWIYDAPVESVWNAWKDVNTLRQFWGPSGCKFIEFSVDFRVGGKYLYCTQFPDGRRVWVTGIYKKIVPNRELVFTDAFSDENGNIVPATSVGLDPAVPLEREAVVMLEPFQDGTKMKFLFRGVQRAMPEEHSDIAYTELCKSFARLSAIIERKS